MPKVKTYQVKATVKNGVAKIDYETKKENAEVAVVEFDSNSIAKHAQEVAEFNNTETTSIASMGDGEYEIDLKLIQ